MSGDYARIGSYYGLSRNNYYTDYSGYYRNSGENYRDMSYCYEKYTVKRQQPAAQPSAAQNQTATENQAAGTIEEQLNGIAENGMISAEKWNEYIKGTALETRTEPISLEDAKQLIAAVVALGEIAENGMISAEKWNEATEGTGLEKRTEPISIKEATEIIEKFNNGEKVNSDEKETPKKNDRDPKDALLNMFPIINYCTRKRLSFIDPIGYTLEDLGVKYYLNPLKTLFDVYVMKEEPTDGVPMADKILSPVLTTITENLISDKDKAEGIRNILNPGAFLIKKGIEYFC